jgi:uncharacterized protein (TIGR02145 family)
MSKRSLISNIFFVVILFLMIACKKSDTHDPKESHAYKVVDIDGNKYDTIHIGTQVWLKQNLKVTRYRNGDSICNIKTNNDWIHSGSGAWCCYSNDTNNMGIYGCLYNLYAVQDPREICPQGWHTPKESDWRSLEFFLVNNFGGKLKEEGTKHWEFPNTGATNSTGFTALPGGIRNHGDGLFAELNRNAYFWTDIDTNSTTNESSRVYMYFTTSAWQGYNNPKDGLSVRCIMD